MRTRCISRVLVLAACLGLTAVWQTRVLGAEDHSLWPSEREARLEELDSEALHLQSELFQARMRGDHAEAGRLAPELRSVKNERLKLLRAAGDI